ncbi:FAD-dependent oxidoreductase [Pseudonocardia ailaonensis]|uniref:FAD-dependent oxidoreductase n=1 Tax=Pseudonocardia ailaonensis TaxID=367279 RepID=A0ABN2NDH4_9PSEU
MSTTYPHVFATGTIGPVEIANRIYFGPTANPLDAGGAPSADLAAFFEERAAGGVGLIIQSLPVAPRGGIGRACPSNESALPAFRAVADRVHGHGTKLFGQLHFFSHLNFQWEPRSPLAPSMSVAGTQRFNSYGVTRAMSVTDIEAVINAYAKAARNLRNSGYDGIEIHSTHGMLPETFLSPFWNHREDGYGGSDRARMRFLTELLETVRDAVGDKMALGVRLQCDELLPGGLGTAECAAVVADLAESGRVDFFDLDVSVEPEQSDLSHPGLMFSPLEFLPHVRKVRRSAGEVPVLSAPGRLTDMADAESLLAEGVLDFAGIVRGLLAEPRLVANARAGRPEDSRRCIAANHCCERRMQYGGFGCGVNPATGRERLWGLSELRPAPARGSVVVVGAGPAGAEAARVAALRGHRVVVFEQRDRIGGQLRLWSRLPVCGPVADIVPWYERQLRDLGVEVRLGRPADAAAVLAESPDAVIVATGARYDATGASGYRPSDIPGADRAHVLTPENILDGGARPAGHVLLLDDEGLHTGVGLAELLAAAGAEVELVTRWPQPAEHLQLTLESDQMLRRLKALAVRFRTMSYVRSIGVRDVTVYDIHSGCDEVVADVDAVVLVTCRRPAGRLAPELEREGMRVFPIGDVLAPRGLPEATYEGHRFARLLGEPTAPSGFTEAFWQEIDPAQYAGPAR